ncbi:MAG TPA: hypothetical protein ENN60_02945 [archaeon]|nr:hypothetical protein [archaeon]
MLNATDWLFGPALIVFSLKGARYDLKHHRIPNSLIIRIFAVSFILNLVFFIKSASLLSFTTYLRYQAYYWAFSLLLFFLEFWKAGDVKFFTAMISLLHPSNDFYFTFPFLVFFAIASIFMFVEALTTRKISFRLKFSTLNLLPVIVAPFLSGFRLVSLVGVLVVIPFVISRRLPFIKSVTIPLTIIMLLLFPLNTLKILAFMAIYTLLASFEFEGYLPSAPFMSVGFLASWLLFP